MKKHLLIATTSVALMAIPSLASAQDESGWYLRGNAGYGTHTDIDITGDVVGDVESEGNAAGSLGLGYDFGNNWRLEGDLAQLQTDLGAISQYPNTSAKLETKTLMLNAIYDFSGFGRWEPYIGAGVGLVRGNATISAHDFPSGPLGSPGVDNVSNPTCVNGVACSFKSGDTGFGWQLLAGLGYAISDNLTWDTHYRYMSATDLDFKGSVAPALGTISSGSATYKDVGAHALMTGFRYRFGEKSKAPAPTPVAVPVAPPSFTCWDGSMVMESYECPAQPQPETYTCWDGTLVYDVAQCPSQPQPETYTCWDGSLVYDTAQCPTQVTQYVPTYNICGPSPVSIFNVEANMTPKSVSRLGTLPEFGDSHGLTADQFYNKLQERYNADAGDRAYLNYLFKSIGYENGFRDAQSYMFSEEVLPAGATGILGLGEEHHYAYSVLNTSDRDREAFRIQGANGTVVHFMKTCGNYMYVCE